MIQPAKPRVQILLVDDLPENLLALSALLEHDDIELLQARTGSEALELLLVHPVALALVDVQMPEMDGFELAELMRGSERTRAVPIIFVTAGSNDQRRVFEGYEAGAVDFLAKPIEPRILKSKVGVFVELAQQKQQLANELREKTETLRLNELFTAMLGHDLRGPLSVIVMGSMVQEKKAPDEVSRKAAARTLDSAKRMSRMISDMLDLARARLGGGIPVTREACDLAALAERVVEGFRVSSPDRLVELRSRGDLHGDWDADRLAQLLSNLIGNAIQHGDASQPVRCRLDGASASEVVFSIENAGAIAADQLPRLFDPFGRGEVQRTRSEGLGLGLYIVEQIALAHGGRVDVQSPGDATTRFTVRLPRAAPPSPDGAGAR